MTEPFSWLVPAFVVAYFCGVIIVSIVDRRRRDKPIWYSDPPSPLFKERFASGNSHRTWFTKIGGATNALVVAVTDRELIVRPMFPITIMFRLPEITSLEHIVPASKIREATSNGNAVDVEFENESGEMEKLTLRLKGQDDFLRALSTLR